ncbi:unnamed protein product [Cylindrotheca closterium]|uniref:Protein DETOXIFICATION n=1 Tax=Cylindrotheca closterium TaxID=2856 RepID=A0AAD2PU22_9STRA|nr:unnamed protein product [Cylindrotheca closterium]
MYLSPSRAKSTLFVLFAIGISGTTAAFATPSKSIVGSLPQRVVSITRQSADNNNPFSEKEAIESTADGIPRGGANINKPPPKLPSFSTYRKFALPCLGLWVAQPLLSLIDTSFVGLSGDKATSAQQLAALGPATTFIDGSVYLFAFLNVAATNIYSTARAQQGEQSDKAESVVRTASRVALRSGIGLLLFLLAFARPLLSLYIGHGADNSPDLLDSAVDYVNIRALSMPTSLLSGVIQAACLGAKDSVTPLIAIVYSTAVNVVGDFLLVNKLGMGLRGAAIATTLAQWAATAALLGPARKRLVRDRSLGLWKKPESKADTVSAKTFLGFAAPVLTLIMGKLAAFGFMTHAAAAIPGQPTPLASHQIILSLFFFASPFMEVISQTAQTFIPGYLAPVADHISKRKEIDPSYDSTKDSLVKPWNQAAFDVGNSLLKIGFSVGVVIASLAGMVPAFRGGLLTSDATVQEAVKPLAKYLLAGAFLTAPVAVSEGILLAKRELKYLASIYLISTALLPSALVRVKVIGGNVEQVWACFAVFQLFRATCFGGKIWLPSLLRKVNGMLSHSKKKPAMK